MSAQSFAMAIGEIAEEERYGCFWTFCPCHADDRPSLIVVERLNGKIEVKCFGGCTRREVTAALKALNLWAPYSRHIKVV